MSTRTVVVGVDASPSSVHALRWACENHEPGDEIIAVMAWEYPTLSLLPPPAGVATSPHSNAHEVADQLLGQAVAEATTGYNLIVSKDTVEGSPAHSVLEMAENTSADLIVLGTRSPSLTKTLLGSVGRRVLHHAQIPVVIVPEGAPTGQHGTVAVAVDGSAHATAALQWALALDVEQITVIHTWQSMRSYSPYIAPVSDEEMEALAHDTVNKVIEEALDGATDDRLHTSMIYGEPRTVLTDEGVDADLLVLGSRGLTGVLGAIVGSVTDYVVAHSALAVAVIPAAES